ncbi:DUF4389 domain-containing protein [Kitasatospora sp. NPDC088346]|uniref:DUF4389 domain-containing protein n=1 Tax=Kitasatospora sp. NPDC088346 TaxID=3364073 RepID=UPI003824D864
MWDASSAVEAEWLPPLDIPEPGPQNRFTVFLRALLALPQIIVVWFLSIAAFVVVVIGWFGALFLGRLPEFAARYLALYVAYDTRVEGYLMLLVDRYPPFEFEPAKYPVRIELRPGPLNRLAVFFRLLLVIPAAIVQNLLVTGWWVVAFFSWLVVLVLGRMPRPLFEATAAVLRYRMRFGAYLLMLTPAYPKRVFGDPEPLAEPPLPPAGAWPGTTAGAPAAPAPGMPAQGTPPEGTAAPGPVAGAVGADAAGAGALGASGIAGASATRPLVVSGAGKALLVLFLVAGLASSIASSVTRNYDSDDYYATAPAFGGQASGGPADVPGGTTRDG